MADLQVRIVNQDVRVSDAAANSTLSIEISNATDKNVSYALFIIIPYAFVAADDVGKVAFDREVERDTRYESDKPQKTGTRWLIGSARGTPIEMGGKLALNLSNITAAKPGDQNITIEWSARGKKTESAAVTVTVLAPEAPPKIVSFEPDPYVLTTSRIRQPIKLTWQTDADSSLELTRFGEILFTGPSTGQSMKYEDTDYSSGVQAYQLTATAKGSGRAISRWRFVRVQDPGWNSTVCNQGAPTLLLNDGDNTLYGVFTRNDEASIYRLNPQQGSVGRRDVFAGKVPSGMEESPGVFFNNMIWLIGGSQIDPETCSNTVWRFNPLTNESETMTASWPVRMGHACAVFDGKIWVLGGMDDNGNTLDDVWCSRDGRKWESRKNLPMAVCLLTATAFDDRLWFYGGADGPFGTPQRALYYRTAGSDDWQLMHFRRTNDLSARANDPPAPDLGGDPFASALCVAPFAGALGISALTLLVTMRRGAPITSRALQISGASYDDNPPAADIYELSYPMDKAWPQQPSTGALVPFRLSAVTFKGLTFVGVLASGSVAGDKSPLSYLVQQ